MITLLISSSGHSLSVFRQCQVCDKNKPENNKDRTVVCIIGGVGLVKSYLWRYTSYRCCCQIEKGS